jgi:hypothetical protein
VSPCPSRGPINSAWEKRLKLREEVPPAGGNNDSNPSSQEPSPSIFLEDDDRSGRGRHRGCRDGVASCRSRYPSRWRWSYKESVVARVESLLLLPWRPWVGSPPPPLGSDALLGIHDELGGSGGGAGGSPWHRARGWGEPAGEGAGWERGLRPSQFCSNLLLLRVNVFAPKIGTSCLTGQTCGSMQRPIVLDNNLVGSASINSKGGHKDNDESKYSQPRWCPSGLTHTQKRRLQRMLKQGSMEQRATVIPGRPTITKQVWRPKQVVP